MLTFKHGSIKIVDFGGAPFPEPPVTQASLDTVDWLLKMTKKWPAKPFFPECPRPRENRNCVCGKPLLLYVPPGEVAHPCPVHPEYAIRGQEIRC